MASSSSASVSMPPAMSAPLRELQTSILDLIRSVAPGPSNSFLLMDDSDSDADVPLDGLWSQALTLASTALDPATDLPHLPLALTQCVAQAALPPNCALDPHFYLLAATVTDLDAAHTVLSLTDLPAAVNHPGVLPDAWVPLWPRMMVDVVLRSARWHRLPVDAEAVTMEMPLLVLAFATARMARLSDPACFVDDATTRQLLTSLHTARTLRHLEPLHDALAQLLLAINDQSLAWPLTPPTDPDTPSIPPLPMNTPLLRAICHSPLASHSSPTSPACTPPPLPTSSPPSATPACTLSSPAAHSFTETLVFLLNRAAHASDQLLVLKPVYVILAVRADLFYTNDVRVLLQVVLRVLRDDECSLAVRNALLRVLEVGVPSVQRVGLVDEVRRVVRAVGEWVRVGKVRDDVGGTTGRVVARVLEVLGES